MFTLISDMCSKEQCDDVETIQLCYFTTCEIINTHNNTELSENKMAQVGILCVSCPLAIQEDAWSNANKHMYILVICTTDLRILARTHVLSLAGTINE